MINAFCLKRIWLGMALAVTICSFGTAHALTLLDTGVIKFEATGSQFGRLSRNYVPSDWSEAKPFPGVTGAPTLRGYETFTINPVGRAYLQIMIDDPAGAFLASAYDTAFTPLNTAPFYGLDMNYLGDAAMSGNNGFGNPDYFQIYDPGLTPVIIVLTEVSLGYGTDQNFGLLVEGFYSREYSEVPEPTTFLLLGGGIAGLAVFRQRNWRS